MEPIAVRAQDQIAALERQLGEAIRQAVMFEAAWRKASHDLETLRAAAPPPGEAAQ